MNNEYNLTFHEALDCVLNNECWVQGEDFASEAVMRLDKDFTIICDCFSDSWPMMFTTGVSRQMFRKVYTQPGAKK